MAMDKNLCHFLRDDAYTVEVRFPTADFKDFDMRTYTYVVYRNIIGQLCVGDYVLVLTRDGSIPHLVMVQRVDEELELPLAADFTHKCIIGKTQMMEQQYTEYAATLQGVLRKQSRKHYQDHVKATLMQDPVVAHLLGNTKSEG